MTLSGWRTVRGPPNLPTLQTYLLTFNKIFFAQIVSGDTLCSNFPPFQIYSPQLAFKKEREKIVTTTKILLGA